jgi:hypothetical protein
VIGRRTILLGALAWALARPRGAGAQREIRQAGFTARVTLLYGLLRFEETGSIDEFIDRVAGRYEVRITGRGDDLASEIGSTGSLREGRWTPERFHDRFTVYGRESRLEIRYDPARRVVEYHGRSETFLLRRIRTVDDVVPVPAGVHVDDVVSAALNYADGRWAAEPDGSLATQVVRRRRSPGEGPDDVERGYRAELVPFVLRVTPDPVGRTTAAFDLTRFSSWARETDPARLVFGSDRRPESINATLILGTTITIRIAPAPAAAS